MEDYFEDKDYIRYYQLFNDPDFFEEEQPLQDYDPEFLEDDEITDEEDGFWRGYEE